MIPSPRSFLQNIFSRRRDSMMRSFTSTDPVRSMVDLGSFPGSCPSRSVFMTEGCACGVVGDLPVNAKTSVAVASIRSLSRQPLSSLVCWDPTSQLLRATGMYRASVGPVYSLDWASGFYEGDESIKGFSFSRICINPFSSCFVLRPSSSDWFGKTDVSFASYNHFRRISALVIPRDSVLSSGASDLLAVIANALYDISPNSVTLESFPVLSENDPFEERVRFFAGKENSLPLLSVWFELLQSRILREGGVEIIEGVGVCPVQYCELRSIFGHLPFFDALLRFLAGLSSQDQAAMLAHVVDRLSIFSNQVLIDQMSHSDIDPQHIRPEFDDLTTSFSLYINSSIQGASSDQRVLETILETIKTSFFAFREPSLSHGFGTHYFPFCQSLAVFDLRSDYLFVPQSVTDFISDTSQFLRAKLTSFIFMFDNVYPFAGSASFPEKINMIPIVWVFMPQVDLDMLHVIGAGIFRRMAKKPYFSIFWSLLRGRRQRLLVFPCDKSGHDSFAILGPSKF